MNILVCYNDSEVSKKAITLAGMHAKRFKAKLYIIMSMAGGAETNADDVKAAEEKLDNVKNSCLDDGIECEIHLLIRGLSPGEDIVMFAGEHNMGEIVMGIEKKSKVGKLIFGSTAQYVILEAPCPVVTVK